MPCHTYASHVECSWVHQYMGPWSVVSNIHLDVHSTTQHQYQKPTNNNNYKTNKQINKQKLHPFGNRKATHVLCNPMRVATIHLPEATFRVDFAHCHRIKLYSNPASAVGKVAKRESVKRPDVSSVDVRGTLEYIDHRAGTTRTSQSLWETRDLFVRISLASALPQHHEGDAAQNRQRATDECAINPHPMQT